MRGLNCGRNSQSLRNFCKIFINLFFKILSQLNFFWDATLRHVHFESRSLQPTHFGWCWLRLKSRTSFRVTIVLFSRLNLESVIFFQTNATKTRYYRFFSRVKNRVQTLSFRPLKVLKMFCSYLTARLMVDKT